MRIRKDVVLAILITFCFTVSFLMVIPISANTYDPMLDYYHEGKIGLKDLVALAGAYGTTGDPTLNVNVNSSTNYDLQQGTLSMTNMGLASSLTVFCGGYSRLSLLFNPLSASLGSNNAITVYLEDIIWYAFPPIQGSNPEAIEWQNPNVFNVTINNGASSWSNQPTFVTETKAPYCTIFFTYSIPIGVSLPAIWSVTFNCAVYLRNE